MTRASCATAATRSSSWPRSPRSSRRRYLLIYGELPTPEQLADFDARIRRHTLLHEDLKGFFHGFPRDAHPMPVLSSAVSALSTFYQDSLDPFDAEQVEISTVRLMAKLPTIAAYAYKKSVGQPFLYPDNSLGLVENFLRMTFGFPAEPYEIDPIMVKALDQLLILHADHEQNCSTSTVRLVGSAQANLFASVSAGINALFGPLHGGANQAVLEMLEQIQDDGGDVDEFVRKVKNKEDGVKLMGFGHRVYKNYDPRAAIVKKTADELLEKLGIQDPLLDIALQLEQVALVRRLLHRAQALPERRLLHRPDLQGDGLPDQDVHRAVRPRPAARLDRPVARDDRGPGDQDRPPAPGLHRRDRAQLRRPRRPLSTGRPPQAPRARAAHLPRGGGPRRAGAVGRRRRARFDVPWSSGAGRQEVAGTGVRARCQDQPLSSRVRLHVRSPTVTVTVPWCSALATAQGPGRPGAHGRGLLQRTVRPEVRPVIPSSARARSTTAAGGPRLVLTASRRHPRPAGEWPVRVEARVRPSCSWSA